MSTAREELLAVVKSFKQVIVANEPWLDLGVVEAGEHIGKAVEGALKPLHDLLYPAKRSTVDAALQAGEAEVAAKAQAAIAHAAGEGLVIGDTNKPGAVNTGTVTLTSADVGTLDVKDLA